MALTEQIESIIQFMKVESLITDWERDILLRKLALCSRSISTELEDERIRNFFEADTLEERIIRATLKDKAYELSETDFRYWLSNFIVNGGKRED